jgi:hypothetical protein
VASPTPPPTRNATRAPTPPTPAVLAISAFPTTGDGSVGERDLNLRWAVLAIAGAFVIGFVIAGFPRIRARREAEVDVSNEN